MLITTFKCNKCHTMKQDKELPQGWSALLLNTSPSSRKEMIHLCVADTDKILEALS